MFRRSVNEMIVLNELSFALWNQKGLDVSVSNKRHIWHVIERKINVEAVVQL